MAEKDTARSGYVAPIVRDYGTIEQITEATGFVDNEDGGSKLLIHHSSPFLS